MSSRVAMISGGGQPPHKIKMPQERHTISTRKRETACLVPIMKSYRKKKAIGTDQLSLIGLTETWKSQQVHSTPRHEPGTCHDMGVRGTLGRLDEMVDAKSEPPDPDQVEDHVQDALPFIFVR